jgi:hypothetical protein
MVTKKQILEKLQKQLAEVNKKRHDNMRELEILDAQQKTLIYEIFVIKKE